MVALGTESVVYVYYAFNKKNKHGLTAMPGTTPSRGSKRQGGCTRRRSTTLLLFPKLLRQSPRQLCRNIRLKTQNPKPGAQ